MIQSELDKQIKSDYDSFMDSPYGKTIPDNILDLFEKAIMVVPPQAHGINFSKVKSIVSKQIAELSVSDINVMIKLIWNTQPQVLYDALYDAIPEQIKLERFLLKFQDHINEFQTKLAQKRTRLESLSNGILNGNSLKSIPNNRY